ncbi:MAG TPA: AAA family ATPase [Magnetospirillaceae bacterium]|nr:AAA family ATPase [Magnetospirillaceae bacterium]
MFLKSIEILGFKSFADRTLIEFAPGISALLGPNGCGKSNVVDSIKWVVGEQSPRSLRAESMEDVIFNGTETRKALNLAEVILHISNNNSSLSLDTPEIAVRRRLYRSGESEYSLNGLPVRLKEIRELFWDTGIGKSAYSVMEQGRIDQILSSRPEERRYLFEEAAGITKHKARSREAELKLGRTEENVRQIQGILGEVKRSHDSLKAQLEKTLAYRAMRGDVFQAELDLHLLRLRGFVQDRARRSEEAAERARARDEALGAIGELNRGLEESLDVVNSMESRLVEHQKTIYGLAVDRAGKEKQRKLLAERVSEARSKIDQARVRRRGAQERLDMLREEAQEKEVETREIQARIVEIARNISSFEANITAADSRIRDNDASVLQSERAIAALDADRSDAQRELDSITDDIVRELDARLKETGYSARDRRAEEEAITGLLAAVHVRLSGKRALLEDLGRLADLGAEEGRALIERARADLERTGTQIVELQARFTAYIRTTPTFIDDFLSPEGIITRKRSVDERILRIKDETASQKDRILALREENRQLSERVDGYRSTLEELRGNRIRMQTQVQAAEDARSRLGREIAVQETVLRELEDEVYLDERRLSDAAEQLSELDQEIAEIETRGRRLSSEAEALERDIARKNTDLGRRREDLRKRTDQLNRLQAELERMHLALAQTDTEIRTTKDAFRETHSRDLMEFEERMYEIRLPAQELRDHLAQLRIRLKDLGSVNLMAPEEYAEVKERFDFLSGQLADLEKAREDLKRITGEIRTESAELFLETYNKIKRNFHSIFRRLFGGGRAELRLEDTDHVLESGIEIYAQPPGKKLEAISLLSGGEKSLTAIALLFATYMVRPSPFCFLDEIDAALDEANVARFVNLLREFGRVSQFIVITHNKKTVVGADTLLGVTMEESGVTKVIAVRLERGEEPPRISPEDAVELEEEEVDYEAGRELAPDSAS